VPLTTELVLSLASNHSQSLNTEVAAHIALGRGEMAEAHQEVAGAGGDGDALVHEARREYQDLTLAAVQHAIEGLEVRT